MCRRVNHCVWLRGPESGTEWHTLSEQELSKSLKIQPRKMAASRLHSQKDKNQAVELSMVLTNREGEPVELSIVLKNEGVDLTHRVPCTGKTDQ